MNDKEAHIFWIALVLTPLVWCILFIIALFGFEFKWLVSYDFKNIMKLQYFFQLVVVIAIMLNGANLYGYIKCKVGNTGTISDATSSFLRQQVLQNAVSFVSGQSKPPQANLMSSPTNTV